MSDNCKEQIWGDYRRRGCSRNAVKDGYCNQHHPDNVKKRREENEKKWLEKIEKSPLSSALRKIETLKAKVKELEGENDELKDFAIWMTGCGYDFSALPYFVKCRDKLLTTTNNGQ